VSCIRVNTEWNAVINRTRILKRRLFFEPYFPSASELHVLPFLQNRYLLNPLLDWDFPGWFEDNQDLDYGLTEKSHHAEVAMQRFTSMPWNAHPAVWRRKDVSWRRMQITQPSVQAVEVQEDGAMSDGFRTSRMGRVPFPKRATLTMGQLDDLVEKRALHNL
jgi:hypothetical protein